MSNTDREITVVVLEPGKAPRARRLVSSLENMQELVGGYIEYLAIDLPGLGVFSLYLNEEGKLRDLPFNRLILGGADALVGTAFISQGDDEGDEIGLTKEEAEAITARIRTTDRYQAPIDFPV